VPESTQGRRAWRQTAAQIEHYWRTHRITDPDWALGPEPHDSAQRADRQRVRGAIDRSRPSSAPPTASATSSRAPSAPTSTHRSSGKVGQAPSEPPASSRKEHPDGQLSILALR
jgi:hypothetical protein